jgi:hypothetical protein
MKATFTTDIIMKNGRVISKGTVANVEFSHTPTRECMLVTLPDGTVIKTAYWQLFFKVPSERTLAVWSMDGVAKSVTGKRVEPDGHGPDGSPSWLLALGYI